MCILCANLLEEIMIDCTKLFFKDYKKSGKSTSSPRLTANSSSFNRCKNIILNTLSCYFNQMLTCAKGHFLHKMIDMGI